ncbi:unnamed protein product [Pelagomonas calceolata]|uniref:DUF202 domain-containing protein n=1 Tax=Pelagomonas calceolata TaxID=35677 RepID=A0A8J2SSX0_9STRA|nr:unnamed protein product [Pelagomonas calceolata]
MTWVVSYSILSCFGPRRGRRGVSERQRSRRWRLHETAPPRRHRRDPTRVYVVIRTPSTRCLIGRGERPRCAAQVFFANERTFLAWVHMALMLGGMAVGIIGFSTKSGLSPLPGLVLLPVAICFVVHALGQYYARARAIRRREPGPYEDKNGPVALAIVLSLAACSNILIHLVVSSR